MIFVPPIPFSIFFFSWNELVLPSDVLLCSIISLCWLFVKYFINLSPKSKKKWCRRLLSCIQYSSSLNLFLMLCKLIKKQIQTVSLWFILLLTWREKDAIVLVLIAEKLKWDNKTFNLYRTTDTKQISLAQWPFFGAS